MRRFAAGLIGVFALCAAAVCAALAENQVPDLSRTPLSVLNQIKQDIAEEYRIHYDIDDLTREDVIRAAKTAVEDYYTTTRGRVISWAWHSWEYQVTRDKDLFTFSSHVDYREAGRDRKEDVKALLYWDGTGYSVYELDLGVSVSRPSGAVIPDSRIMDESRMVINRRTGLNLSLMTRDELNALKAQVDRQIVLNHYPGSTSRVNYILEKKVEELFRQRGIRISWPSFDYTYTCDWNCYTETARVSWDENGNSCRDIPVYAELYPEDITWQVRYLKIGVEVLIDELDQVTGGEGQLFLTSRQYESALAMIDAGRFEEAVAVLGTLGDYEDSAALKAEYQERIDHADYMVAVRLMQEGSYEEAAGIFDAQGDYADSREKAAECRETLNSIRYEAAMDQMDAGEYEAAWQAFTDLGDYRSSKLFAEDCLGKIHWDRYREAVGLMESGDYAAAIELFRVMQGYKDSWVLQTQCENILKRRDYDAAEALMEAGEYEQALMAFLQLGAYLDSVEKANEAGNLIFAREVENLFGESGLVLLPGQKTVLPGSLVLGEGAGAQEISLRYRTRSSDVVRLEKDGKTVTALRTGYASVWCTPEGEDDPEAVLTVRVASPVSKVSLSASKMKLNFPAQDGSDTSQLTYTLEPRYAYVQTGTWSSANEAVAVVDGEGNVRAVGAGTAVITFTSDDASQGKKEARCTVTVIQAAAAVELNETSGTLYPGKTVQLKATVLPKNAANRKVTWSSADESVAVVGASGKVKAVSPGETVITASSPAGPSAQYILTVKPAPVPLKVTVSAEPENPASGTKGWQKKFTLNGAVLSGGAGKVSAQEGDIVTIGGEFRYKEKLPDGGSFSEEILITREILANGLETHRTVTVSAAEGTPGAAWNVTIRLTP